MLHQFFATLTDAERMKVLEACNTQPNDKFMFDENGGIYITDNKVKKEYLPTHQIFERLDDKSKQLWKEKGFIK